MEKILIAYFSRADENYFAGEMRYIKIGNTEIAVRKIKNIIEADVFKIEMRNPYSPVYKICIEEAKKDLQEKNRPELVTLPESISKYNNIILAYPNYWGTMPMAVFTFLEKFDFNGKTILPLCTNEGSGMGRSEKDIINICPGAIIKNGLSITGSDVENSESQIKNWLKSNNVITQGEKN